MEQERYFGKYKYAFKQVKNEVSTRILVAGPVDERYFQEWPVEVLGQNGGLTVRPDFEEPCYLKFRLFNNNDREIYEKVLPFRRPKVVRVNMEAFPRGFYTLLIEKDGRFVQKARVIKAK